MPEENARTASSGSATSEGSLPAISPWPSSRPTRSSRTRARSSPGPSAPSSESTTATAAPIVRVMFVITCSVISKSSQESRTVERCVLVLICVGDLLEPFVCCYCLRSGVCAAAILAESHSVVTSEVIQQAFQRTEEGFTALVSELWSSRPQIATTGTCCLVGVICRQTLFVASLGDSRAVLGRRVGNTGGMAAIQLSTEHNANIEAIRQELKELHPDDPQIVVLRHGVWRVKGIIQVSRSIGDVYMKHAQFNREPINAKFRLPEPMNMPFLSANPTVISHPIQPNDSFLIFASDGLWEHLSNDQAVDIVHSSPRAGSAKRLIKAALQEAARKREMRYSDLYKIDKKVRRHFHDDITVIVLFLNHDLISRGAVLNSPLTVRSALDH
ncbi:protein phosphatase 2C 42 [Vigna angularis]|uniref:Protein phosphatase 2C 42 n=1 Tax=Phaseolus angularis TaxID=3914 RepID=A0A8T0K824_PHAAN|nr:protein phosphatase 2C 42 [Vigna angularis]